MVIKGACLQPKDRKETLEITASLQEGGVMQWGKAAVLSTSHCMWAVQPTAHLLLASLLPPAKPGLAKWVSRGGLVLGQGLANRGC